MYFADASLTQPSCHSRPYHPHDLISDRTCGYKRIPHGSLCHSTTPILTRPKPWPSYLSIKDCMPSVDGEPGRQIRRVPCSSSPGTASLASAVMSSSPAKDNEKAVTVAADEVELARMGYKQELKFVSISLGQRRVLTFSLSHRRDLSLVQVPIHSSVRTSSLFVTCFSELWCFVLHYQHYDWYTFALPLRFGTFSHTLNHLKLAELFRRTLEVRWLWFGVLWSSLVRE